MKKIKINLLEGRHYMKKNHLCNFIVFTTLAAISIHGVNKAISITSSKKKLLKKDNGRFFKWRYGNLYYSKQGKGSPLLLIHDLNPASSDYEWHKVIRQLSKHHTVYTLDLLGCGRSHKPNITYTNFLYVQLITDFIKNIINTKTDVIAMGESSSFTLMACNMESDCFDKIIIINPSDLSELHRTPNKIKNLIKYIIDSPIIGTFIYNLTFCKKSVENIFAKKYIYNSRIISSTAIDYYYESAHLNNQGKYLLSSIKTNYTNINVAHALKKIKNNIYLIGSIEIEGMQNIIDSYISCNPSIESSYISDVKYLPQLENAEKLLQIITDIL